MEKNFEPKIEMPEKLVKHLEGEETLTTEELAGGPISDKETIPATTETPEKNIDVKIETDPEKIFENIKSLVEAEAGEYIPEGFLDAAKKQLELKMNNPAFGRDRAIEETVSFLKTKMKIEDSLEAFRKAAKIPYQKADALVTKYKANSLEVSYEDVMKQLQEAQEAVKKAKDERMMTYLKQWTSEIEELKNTRG